MLLSILTYSLSVFKYLAVLGLVKLLSKIFDILVHRRSEDKLHIAPIMNHLKEEKHSVPAFRFWIN